MHELMKEGDFLLYMNAGDHIVTKRSDVFGAVVAWSNPTHPSA
jgi:hypothetical protein